MAAADDDIELLRSWRAGDQPRGNELVRRHFRSVHRFFRTKVDGEIDDLIQRTFLGCVEAIDRFRQHSNFKTFLLAIARNQLLLHYREVARDRRREAADLSVRELGGGRSATALVVRAEEEGILLEALRRLPLDQQITLELFYWENLAVGQVAEVLGVAAGTVKSRLGRAREALREHIGALEADELARSRTAANLDEWAAGLRDLVDES
jgi:RNA polymerase sigma-70 factor (ECF subfamily)